MQKNKNTNFTFTAYYVPDTRVPYPSAIPRKIRSRSTSQDRPPKPRRLYPDEDMSKHETKRSKVRSRSQVATQRNHESQLLTEASQRPPDVVQTTQMSAQEQKPQDVEFSSVRFDYTTKYRPPEKQAHKECSTQTSDLFTPAQINSQQTFVPSRHTMTVYRRYLTKRSVSLPNVQKEAETTEKDSPLSNLYQRKNVTKGQSVAEGSKATQQTRNRNSWKRLAAGGAICILIVVTSWLLYMYLL